MILSKEELEQYTKLLDVLPDKSAEHKKVWQLLQLHQTDVCKERFLPYVKRMWPGFIAGRHHKIMADAFERVARGELKRLIINMAPRHTKSEFASYLLPSWFLGLYPEKKIIQTAHTAELAVGFGRKVRNLVDSPDYQAIFSTKLSSDSKAAGRWNTSKGGDYFAIGVGGAVTGKGADLLIIDDPHSEQEATQGATDPGVYDKVYEWYTSGPRQRLQPGGAIVIVMCMTGDTPVLMANGLEKPLKDIRPGDLVATFDKGRLLTSRINNWRSSGIDSIYKIQTQSGRILRANERHPFLVMNEGVLEWTRLKHLKRGDLLVSLKDAADLLGQKQSPGSAALAKQKTAITAKTQMRHTSPWATMENGGGLCASWMGVKVLWQAVGYVLRITTKNTSSKNLRKTLEGTVLSIDTESLLSSMKQWLRIAATYATYVSSRQAVKIPALIGTEGFVLTTPMTREWLEDYSATTATLPLAMGEQQAYLNELRRISDFTAEKIVSITPDGEEEVFDVEVDQTENFIANGFVSHNTRWAKRDLTGRILNRSIARDTKEWEVIEFPAIMPSGNPLWPEFWSQEELEAVKEEISVSKWNAQYMQNPTSEEGAIIKRDMWRIWEEDRAPHCSYVIQSWDTAFEKHNRADYSACTTWGVFYRENEDGREVANIMLLDAFKDRMEFPTLKKTVYEMWKEWNPDTLLIEKKAAGAPLVYEMRKMGIPISEYTPTRGSDKIARVNAISDMFASGLVWCPDRRWAEEVVEELAEFPNGDHDDLVDSSSQALLRFRQGGFIVAPTDEQETVYPRRKVRYY